MTVLAAGLIIYVALLAILLYAEERASIRWFGRYLEEYNRATAADRDLRKMRADHADARRDMGMTGPADLAESDKKGTRG